MQVPSKFGNASSPKSVTFISASVIVSGISYSSLSSASIYLASSIDIAKLTPSCSACTSRGSSLK